MKFRLYWKSASACVSDEAFIITIRGPVRYDLEIREKTGPSNNLPISYSVIRLPKEYVLPLRTVSLQVADDNNSGETHDAGVLGRLVGV